MPTDSLNVLVVRDGRPGHEKQTWGIVAALRRHRVVKSAEIRITPGISALFTSLSVLLGARLGVPEEFFPDVIIGTGTHTHLTVLALKNRLGGRAVTCMAPGRLLRRRFDLCCVPRHDEIAEGGNIMLTDGPPGLNSNLRQHDPAQGLILVGGVDEKSHGWDNEKMACRVASMVLRYPHLSWTLTTSPRTPAAFLDAFGKISKKISVRLCPFGETPPGWLEQALNRSKYVAVTEDSMSMIFEALSAGCCVGTIPVDFKKNNKFVRSLHELKTRDLLVTDFTSPKPQADGRKFDVAGQCAAEMVRRWWNGA
jgi:hypothetical protein